MVCRIAARPCRAYGLSVDAGENDFERRVRASEEALLLQDAAGGRPFGERWSYFLLMTLWPWSQVVLLCVDVAQGWRIERHRFVAVAILVVAVPAFAWSRSRKQQRRTEVRARQAE